MFLRRNTTEESPTNVFISSSDQRLFRLSRYHQYSRQAEQMSEKITPTYLCINCGESGHLTLFCEDRAAQPPVEKVVMRGDPGLCERCHYLDLPGLLKDPGEKRDGDFHGVRLSSSANADIKGLVRHIQISHDHPLILQCPSCRVLFACADGCILMHEPRWRRGDDPPWMHFGLFRSYWRDNSLVGFARPVYEEDMNAFATYIQGLNHGGTVECGDEVFALEAAAFADRPDPPALCARAVRSGEVDYSSIRDWLGICATKHVDSCSMPTSPLLRKIKLIDVKARRIVQHPGGDIQYLRSATSGAASRCPRSALAPFRWLSRPQSTMPSRSREISGSNTCGSTWCASTKATRPRRRSRSI